MSQGIRLRVRGVRKFAQQRWRHLRRAAQRIHRIGCARYKHIVSASEHVSGNGITLKSEIFSPMVTANQK